MRSSDFDCPTARGRKSEGISFARQSSSFLMSSRFSLGRLASVLPVPVHRTSRSRYISVVGKSPCEMPCSCATAWKIISRFFSSSFCFFSFPNIAGIIFRRQAHTSACTFAVRALFTSSFTRRTAAFFGISRKSRNRSDFSLSKSTWPSAPMSLYAWSQNELIYTRVTSGVRKTLPNDHIKAPYTRISCCGVTWSALLRTMRILSSLPARFSMTILSSSEISSLCASKSKRMRSERSANHLHTSAMS
mmetsp:Transcript_31956/g.46690  ORF Transcript_31956/g.46690 Transcript_31956/m.46690 type:complete len:247 (+) Transcript_31956:179-919(+)